MRDARRATLVTLLVFLLLSTSCRKEKPVTETATATDTTPSATETTTTDTATTAAATAATSDPASGLPAASAGLHITFTGIIALVPSKANGRDPREVRFIAPEDKRGSTDTHQLWVITPADLTTGDTAGAQKYTEAGKDVLLAFPVTGKIEFEGLQSGDVKWDNTDIANSADFHKSSPKAAKEYRTKPPTAPAGRKNLTGYGDLTGGELKASFVSTDQWRYDDDAVDNGETCRQIAQVACHLSPAPTGDFAIRFNGKRIVVGKDANGVIAVRIAHTHGAFPQQINSASPTDPHFELYQQVSSKDDNPKLTPHLCTTTGTKKGHWHPIDGMMVAAGLAQPVKPPLPHGHEPDPLKESTPGAINCPPTWWCPDPPDCG